MACCGNLTKKGKVRVAPPWQIVSHDLRKTSPSTARLLSKQNVQNPYGEFTTICLGFLFLSEYGTEKRYLAVNTFLTQLVFASGLSDVLNTP